MSPLFALPMPALRKRKGYTLIELLMVMAVITILSTISMTALAPLMTSNHLNEATSVVEGQLELAQQTARTLNRSVQLRFYRSQNNTPTAPSIDTLQILVPAENSAVESDQPVEKTILLPPGVIIADSSSDLLLTAFSAAGPTFAPFNPTPPAHYSNSYILTFSPTGAITATDNNGNPVSPSSSTGTVFWVLSLVPQTLYRANGNVSAMRNYATFYLNSVNGTYSCTRP